MKYAACIFDLDGTIIDSQPGILRCVRYALSRMNKPVPDDSVLREFLGPPLVSSFTKHCGMDEAEAVRATAYYRECFNDGGWREAEVYPGIRRMLGDLRRAGQYLGIATGKPQEAAERILKHFGLHEFFDSVVGARTDDYHASKDKTLAQAIAGAGLPAVMVGDRRSDAQAAIKLGLDAVAIGYGYAAAGEFEGLDAVCANSADELRAALGLEPAAHAPGFFISFEGNDGSGKSTQVGLLYEYLSAAGFKITRTREPGGSPIAEKIRELLLDPNNTGMQDMTEALLYAAARAQHVRDVIAPALRDGRIVLSDRYVDSSIAYQGAGRGLGLKEVSRINAPAIGKYLPHLTIFLQLPASSGMQRRRSASKADRIELMDDDFHKRVEAGFQELIAGAPKRIVPVRADRSVNEIAEEIRCIVLQRLWKAGIV